MVCSGRQLDNCGKIAKKYIEDVRKGKTLVCKWASLAVERHLHDLDTGKERGLYFDEESGERILRFFKFLKHSQGEWAGRTFILSPWQQFCLWTLFGWKKEDGSRRFRTAYKEIARKNGKSTEAAGVGLYLLDADNEPGAEIYSAATKRDQAKITHSEATRMVRSSSPLRKHIQIFKDRLSVPDTNSKFEPLSSDYNSLDGLNISGAIVDELHAHKTRDLWDVLETATGARRQPLLFAITTAGVSREGICRELHDYTEKILTGVVEDDSFWGIIFTLDDGDEWQDERLWIKSNPNLGISVKLDDLQRKARKAKNTPAAQNAFLRLHMNVWTSAETAWIPPEAWAKCCGVTDGDFLARIPCYGGLDLSNTTDITAFVLKFPATGDCKAWFWLPERKLEERRDRVPYQLWADQGWIEVTPGSAVDYRYVQERILGLAKEYRIQEIAFDPWNATQTAIELEDHGLVMVPTRQGYKTMSPACRELEREIVAMELKHGGNPVLQWMAANVMVTQDPAGNLKPDKSKSIDKIDGIVALLNAISRQIEDNSTESIYEERGIVSI